MKNNQPPQAAHHTITTARRPDNTRSSALMRSRSTKFMGRPSHEAQSQCSDIGSIFLPFSRRFFGHIHLFNQSFLQMHRSLVTYSNFGTPCPRDRFYHLRLSPMRPNELWTCPRDGAAMAQAHGCQRNSCGSVRRGKGGDRYSQRRS